MERKKPEYYISKEFNEIKEYKKFKSESYKPFELNKKNQEYSNFEELNDTPKPKPQTNPTNEGKKNNPFKNLVKQLSKSVASVTGTVTATVAVATTVVVGGTLTTTTKPDINMLSFDVGINYVDYKMEIDNLDEQRDYQIVISDGFTKDTFPLEEGIVANTVTDLTPFRKYNFEILSYGDLLENVKTSYYSKDFYTGSTKKVSGIFNIDKVLNEETLESFINYDILINDYENKYGFFVLEILLGDEVISVNESRENKKINGEFPVYNTGDYKFVIRGFSNEQEPVVVDEYIYHLDLPDGYGRPFDAAYDINLMEDISSQRSLIRYNVNFKDFRNSFESYNLIVYHMGKIVHRDINYNYDYFEGEFNILEDGEYLFCIMGIKEGNETEIHSYMYNAVISNEFKEYLPDQFMGSYMMPNEYDVTTKLNEDGSYKVLLNKDFISDASNKFMYKLTALTFNGDVIKEQYGADLNPSIDLNMDVNEYNLKIEFVGVTPTTEKVYDSITLNDFYYEPVIYHRNNFTFSKDAFLYDFELDFNEYSQGDYSYNVSLIGEGDDTWNTPRANKGHNMDVMDHLVIGKKYYFTVERLGRTTDILDYFEFTPTEDSSPIEMFNVDPYINYDTREYQLSYNIYYNNYLDPKNNYLVELYQIDDLNNPIHTNMEYLENRMSTIITDVKESPEGKYILKFYSTDETLNKVLIKELSFDFYYSEDYLNYLPKEFWDGTFDYPSINNIVYDFNDPSFYLITLPLNFNVAENKDLYKYRIWATNSLNEVIFEKIDNVLNPVVNIPKTINDTIEINIEIYGERRANKVIYETLVVPNIKLYDSKLVINNPILIGDRSFKVPFEYSLMGISPKVTFNFDTQVDGILETYVNESGNSGYIIINNVPANISGNKLVIDAVLDESYNPDSPHRITNAESFTFNLVDEFNEPIIEVLNQTNEFKIEAFYYSVNQYELFLYNETLQQEMPLNPGLNILSLPRELNTYHLIYKQNSQEVRTSLAFTLDKKLENIIYSFDKLPLEQMVKTYNDDDTMNIYLPINYTSSDPDLIFEVNYEDDLINKKIILDEPTLLLKNVVNVTNINFTIYKLHNGIKYIIEEYNPTGRLDGYIENDVDCLFKVVNGDPTYTITINDHVLYNEQSIKLVGDNKEIVLSNPEIDIDGNRIYKVTLMYYEQLENARLYIEANNYANGIDNIPNLIGNKLKAYEIYFHNAW